MKAEGGYKGFWLVTLSGRFDGVTGEGPSQCEECCCKFSSRTVWELGLAVVG